MTENETLECQVVPLSLFPWVQSVRLWTQEGKEAGERAELRACASPKLTCVAEPGQGVPLAWSLVPHLAFHLPLAHTAM